MMWGRMIAVSLVFLVFDWAGWVTWLRGGMEKVLAPVREVVVFARVRTDSITNAVLFIKNGGIRLVNLERQLAEYSISAVRVAELESENANLRLQLGVLDSKYSYQAVRVISKSDGLILGLDGPAQFSEGAVVLHEDALVGVIDSIGKYSARVRTASSLSMDVELIDSSSRRVGKGKLVGGGQDIVVEGIEQSVDMNTSIVVVIIGLDDFAMNGLVIGRVSQVLSSDSSVYQQAIVEPLTQIQAGDTVYVIVSDKEEI